MTTTKPPFSMLDLTSASATAIAGTNIPVCVSDAAPVALQVKDTASAIDTSLVAGVAGAYLWTNGPDGVRQFFSVNGQIAGFFFDGISPVNGAGLVIGASSYVFGDPQQIGAQFHSNPYSDASTAAPGTMAITNTGQYSVISVNRSSGDVGANELVAWYSSGVFVGSITCTAGVVTYGSFCGSHMSQLQDQGKKEILRGTIVETIDEMCRWATEDGGDEEQNEQLTKFKISDTPGSRRVYGVFSNWDGNARNAGWVTSAEDIKYYDENDAQIASLGAFVIRISNGLEVRGGDLIESNGNGCGRVQADDIMRSSTVAKVTAAVIIETYDDGSYLVPCTLHCG